MQAIIKRVIDEKAAEDLDECHPALKRIYLARGITKKSQLDNSLKKLLSYQNLSEIKKAVEFLATALQAQKHFLIIGDFDADGATSTALAVSALKTFGAKFVDYLVPNRFEYGYGLTPEIVDVAAENKPDIIITVDNGISSIEGSERAAELGIDLIVTDHHLPGRELPKAIAIVNPNQHGDEFLSKNLAGVGVIFYVMSALRARLRELNYFENNKIAEPKMTQFLDLVALGTVADVVPLDHNNRVLVQQGLARIRAGHCRVGIKALFAIANRSINAVVASDLGFALGPRLNAAGRLDDMSLGIECLLCEDYFAAYNMAENLDALNQERKRIETDMQAQAFADLNKLNLNEKKNSLNGICVFDKGWHQGVIGILASRIKDRFHRPVIAFALVGDNEIKGSARSVKGLHIRDILDAVATNNPGLITKFGGHAMAAGLSLKKDNFKKFSQAFANEVDRCLKTVTLDNNILSDGDLTEADFTLEFTELLREAGPWGQLFPEPLFDGQFRLLQQRIVGHKHLKCVLALDNSPQQFDAIAFNIDLEHWPDHRIEKVHVAYRLDINEYKGVRRLQLMIEKMVKL